MEGIYALWVHSQKANAVTNTSLIISFTVPNHLSHFTLIISDMQLFSTADTEQCCLPPVYLYHTLYCTCVWLLPYLCSILASSSSCWHLIFTHQFFSSWKNAAVRLAAELFTNILSFVCRPCERSNLEMGWICPLSTDSWGSVRLSTSHTNMHRRSESHTQTHKSSFSFWTCDLC